MAASAMMGESDEEFLPNPSGCVVNVPLCGQWP